MSERDLRIDAFQENESDVGGGPGFDFFDKTADLGEVDIKVGVGVSTDGPAHATVGAEKEFRGADPNVKYEIQGEVGAGIEWNGDLAAGVGGNITRTTDLGEGGEFRLGLGGNLTTDYNRFAVGLGVSRENLAPEGVHMRRGSLDLSLGVEDGEPAAGLYGRGEIGKEGSQFYGYGEADLVSVGGEQGVGVRAGVGYDFRPGMSVEAGVGYGTGDGLASPHSDSGSFGRTLGDGVGVHAGVKMKF